MRERYCDSYAALEEELQKVKADFWTLLDMLEKWDSEPIMRSSGYRELWTRVADHFREQWFGEAHD